MAPAGQPEIEEVGSAVNLLADRIGELLLAEREAAADVSHRLRTPMTALKLAVEGITDGEARDRVSEELDRLEQSVDEGIREMRRPVDAQELMSDLAKVVAARAAFWLVLAEEQGRTMSLDLPEGPAPVGVRPADLDAVIDALLNNVFAHTETGVALSLQVADAGGAPGGCASRTRGRVWRPRGSTRRGRRGGGAAPASGSTSPVGARRRRVVRCAPARAISVARSWSFGSVLPMPLARDLVEAVAAGSVVLELRTTIDAARADLRVVVARLERHGN